MLGAAAYGLHRRPHVCVLGEKVPARRLERGSLDAASVIDEAGSAFQAVLDHTGPDLVAIALHNRVRPAELMSFLGKERGVDSTVDDAGAALTGKLADLVPAQRIAGVDADADYVAGLDRLRIQLLQSFVNDVRVSQVSGCGRGQHVKP